MATRLLKGTDVGEESPVPCFPQNRATRATWFSFATQPRASFDVLRAHLGKDLNQKWVIPISIGWLQALLVWANTPFL